MLVIKSGLDMRNCTLLRELRQKKITAYTHLLSFKQLLSKCNEKQILPHMKHNLIEFYSSIHIFGKRYLKKWIFVDVRRIYNLLHFIKDNLNPCPFLFLLQQQTFKCFLKTFIQDSLKPCCGNKNWTTHWDDFNHREQF